MRIGILSDTHDQLDRTITAVQLLKENGAEALIHCGDLCRPAVVAACADLPFWFALGNHDADSADELRRAAKDHGAVCLDWGGLLELSGRRLGVTHGHLRTETRQVIASRPEILFRGHTHECCEIVREGVRMINPGALFRAEQFTVALLDLDTEVCRFLEVPFAFPNR